MTLWTPCIHRGQAGTYRCWCRHPERKQSRPTAADCAACELVTPQLQPLPEVSLHDVLIISTSFNPAGYQSVQRNHRNWWEQIHRQGLNALFLTAFADYWQLSAILRGFHPRKRFLTPIAQTMPVLWQKEPMLNWLATECVLSLGFEYIAWIDADLFADWAPILQHAKQKLQQGTQLVQLFESITYLDRQGGVDFIRPGCVASWCKDGSRGAQGGAWLARKETLAAAPLPELHVVGANDDLYWQAARVPHAGGATGGALMAHRSTLHAAPLPELAVVGGGDQLYLDAAFLGAIERHAEHWTPDMKRWYARFAVHTQAVIQGRVDYVPTRLTHHWHGDRRDRQYWERHALLKKFTPEMVTRPSGTPFLQWTDKAPAELREAVAQYFWDRQEDGRAEVDGLPICQHRGETVGEIKSSCPACEGKPIFACAVHGRCVGEQRLREAAHGARSCDVCPEIQE